MEKLFVYIALDRSGSMNTMMAEAINGINVYVENLGADVAVQLTTFDSVSLDTIRKITEEWRPLNKDEVAPRASTPLYRVICDTIDELLERKPNRAIVVIMTDGHENSSGPGYSSVYVKNKIAAAESAGYPVVFIGASFIEIDKVGNGLGAVAGRTLNFGSGNVEKGYVALADKSKAYLRARGVGAQSMSAMTFSNEEKKDLV